MRLDLVDVVLVRAARAANVAAACRALKNMGVGSLRLVEAPAGLAEPEARALAYGAWDVLDAAARFASLPEAVADAVLVVATSGRPSEAAWTPRQLAERAGLRCGEGRLAVVFGPEASGLTQAELQLCHEIVRIPTDPAQSSLNLAQAVLLIAYELFLGRLAEGASGARSQAEPAASVGDVEAGLTELRQGLIEIGYLNPENPDAVFSEIRRLLARAVPTARELALVRGLARQVAWAGRRIGAAGG